MDILENPRVKEEPSVEKRSKAKLCVHVQICKCSIWIFIVSVTPVSKIRTIGNMRVIAKSLGRTISMTIH